jgi:uncharacterized protein
MSALSSFLPLPPWQLALACLAALAAGCIDAIAGGGGLITVPSLLGLGLPVHNVLGTNKAQSSVGTAAATWTFAQKGKLTRERAAFLFVGAFFGGLGGAFTVMRVPREPLRPIMVLLLLCAAVISAWPRKKTAKSAVGSRAALPLAFAIGFYDGFFGPGTGAFLVVAMTRVFGDDEVLASGNAKLANLASNLASLVIFVSAGQVLFALALPMAFANALGASLGVRLAIRLGKDLVRRTTFMILALLVVKVLYDSRDTLRAIIT